LLALDYLLDSSKEIVVVGDLKAKEAIEFRKMLGERFLPNSITAFGSPAKLDEKSALTVFKGKVVLGDKPTIYVCENQTCKKPTNDPNEALSTVEKNLRY
jgi:uncharacterized protein YyaL (SSP411 family)